MQRSPSQKPYKVKWIEAERELTIRGFLSPPIVVYRISPRLRTDKLPVMSPSQPEKLRLPR